jgi:hypothetical protein
MTAHPSSDVGSLRARSAPMGWQPRSQCVRVCLDRWQGSERELHVALQRLRELWPARRVALPVVRLAWRSGHSRPPVRV